MPFPRMLNIVLTLMVMGVFFITSAPKSSAHEVNPAVINITVAADRVDMEMAFNAEVFLAGIDASTTEDTNDAAEADVYDQLRAVPSADLTSRINDQSQALLDMITLTAGDQAVALRLGDITVDDIADLSLPRLSSLIISADLPENDDAVTLRLNPRLGAYIIRQNNPLMAEDDLYTDYIAAGLETLPIPRQDKVERSWQATFAQYLQSGIAHIIPKGLDHIVFIMGLYFFSPRFRPLLMQVTVFTLAHSFTLALASMKLILIPASIVEPLIALSIVWIGVENIIRPKIGLGRLTVIFGFGLLHGLGFAFVLGEVGLAPSLFAVSLIAFNIGVEIGQLLVLAPLVIMGLFISHRKGYRQRVETPASLIIAAIGLYWFLERVL